MTSFTNNVGSEELKMYVKLRDYDAVCLAGEGSRKFLRTILDWTFA